MIEMIPINLDNGKAIGISVKYPKTTLLSISTEVGYIMCGVLNIEGVDKLHADRDIIAARMTKVKTFDDMLRAKVVEATQEAQKIGIVPKMTTGRQALELMLKQEKNRAS